MSNLTFFLISFLFLSSYTVGQDIEQKNITLSDQSKMIYNVNNENKLDGSFSVVSRVDNEILLRGLYKNGTRTGNWYSFNSNGKMFLRYNYDLNKLLFLDTASLNRINVGIDHKDDVVKKNASISFPIASIDQYISLLGTELKRVLLSEDKNASGKLDVNLIARIDKKGNADYFAEYKDKSGFGVSKKLKIAEKLFNLEWIPASYKNQNLASIFTVKMTLDLSTSDNRQRFMWAF